jgi:hypothetical protein
MSVRIKGTTNLQEVDANGAAYVNTPMTDVQAGFTSMLAENDAGTVTGNRYVKAVEVSDDFRVRVGVDSMILNEQFPGAAFNTAIWQTPVTTMTATVATGYANLNAGLSVAAGAVAQLRTYRHFPAYKQYTTYCEMEVQLTAAPVSGNRCEWGLVLMSGTAAPTDGVFFRVDNTGLFKGVLSYNGTETEVTIPSEQLVAGATASYLIYIGSTVVEFWINNILVGEIHTPVGQGSSVSSMNLPLAFRNHNVSATSIAQVMKIGNVNITWGDQNGNKPWGHVMTGTGAHASQGQTGGTMGSTAIYTNAAAAAAAALTNTTAAAGNVGLGGIINVLPTLTANTDGILCSYQVPVGTATLPGKSLYITKVKINSAVTTVLAGGPVIYAISAAYGHTAVSLATTESATTKAPRRVPLGIQSFAATAAVGVQGVEAGEDFSVAPILVQPGEYFQIAVRNLGTVTTTGAITFVVTVSGYWE